MERSTPDKFLTSSKMIPFTSFHRASIPPIKRLPVETLEEIFLCCLAIELELADELYGLVSPFDWRTISRTLSYVCHQWRSILLTRPRLWPQRIAVSLPGYGQSWLTKEREAPKNATELLKMYLERSKSLPLEIGLNWALDGEPPYLLSEDEDDELASDISSESEDLDPSRKLEDINVISILFQHANRFECLRLGLLDTRDNTIHDPLPERPITFPRLKKICIGDIVSHEPQPRLPPWLENALETAPNLHQLHIAALYDDDPEDRAQALEMVLNLPFLRQLTVVELGDYRNCNSVESALLGFSILERTPILEEFRMTIDPEHGPVPSDAGLPRKMTMPRLRNLNLRSHRPSIQSVDLQFVSRLILPSLTELKLVTGTLCDQPSSILRLINVSGCALTSLFLQLEDNDGPNAADMLTLLNHLPMLRTLDIRHSMPQSLIIAITRKDDDDTGTSTFCPHLERLRFRNISVGNVEDGVWYSWLGLITDLVRSRSQPTDPGVATLQEFGLSVRHSRKSLNNRLPAFLGVFSDHLRVVAEEAGCRVSIERFLYCPKGQSSPDVILCMDGI